jgi:ABC-type transport system involved in multi-copper enzyme maturation permease subunit
MSELEVIQISSSTLLGVIFVFCAVGMIGRSPESAVPVLILIFGGFLVYGIACFAWWSLIYVQTLPVDRTLAYFRIYSSNAPRWFGSLLILGPPVIPVLGLLGIFVYGRRYPKASKLR